MNSIVQLLLECRDWILASGAIKAMYPVLTIMAEKDLSEQKHQEKAAESFASKLLVAVMIQTLTGTAAAVAASYISITVMEYKIDRLERELAAVEKRGTEERERHFRYFHEKQGPR